MCSQPIASQFTDSEIKAYKHCVHFVWKDMNKAGKESTGSSKRERLKERRRKK